MIIIYITIFIITGLIGMCGYILFTANPVLKKDKPELLNGCIAGSIIGIIWVVITKIILYLIFKI